MMKDDGAPPREKYSNIEVASAEVESALPSVTATPMMEVIAPSTLPEGYKFEADVNGAVMSVEVPKGGVEEGQRFMVPVPDGTEKARASRPSIPVGNWRDGWCNCFVYGACHPQLCLSCWCTPLANAQIMTRMNLNWYGMPGSVADAASTFKKVVMIVVVYMAVTFFLGFVGALTTPPITYDDYGNPVMEFSMTYQVVLNLRRSVALCMTVYMVVAIMNTRSYIRSKYAIPENDCRGCEDLCCALWCSCCVVAQMGRHTADFDTHPAMCCTENGLSEDATPPV